MGNSIPRSGSCPRGKLGLVALASLLGCASEDTAIEVALEISPAIDDAALASVDSLRVESSEGAYAKESGVGHRLARSGETLIYRPGQVGQGFDLSIELLAQGVAMACGTAKNVVAKQGETVRVVVTLSTCAATGAGSDAGAADTSAITPGNDGATLDRAREASREVSLDTDLGNDDISGAKPEVATDRASVGSGDDTGNASALDAAADDAFNAVLDAATDLAHDLAVDRPPAQATGTVCNDDDECATGFCAQGVCCAERCSGTCNVCDRAGKLGVCQVLPSTECAPDSRITDLWPLQCVGGGYNPEADGPRRGSNRSRGATWELSLTIGDPSPACVRNSPADPVCATPTWQLDLGFAFTTAME